MPSPGFSAGHFQQIMRQKCSRKLYKNNDDWSQAKGEASTLKTDKLRYQPANTRSYIYVYKGLLGSLIFRPSSYFAEEILVSSCY